MFFTVILGNVITVLILIVIAVFISLPIIVACVIIRCSRSNGNRTTPATAVPVVVAMPVANTTQVLSQHTPPVDFDSKLLEEPQPSNEKATASLAYPPSAQGGDKIYPPQKEQVEALTLPAAAHPLDPSNLSDPPQLSALTQSSAPSPVDQGPAYPLVEVQGPPGDQDSTDVPSTSGDTTQITSFSETAS